MCCYRYLNGPKRSVAPLPRFHLLRVATVSKFLLNIFYHTPTPTNVGVACVEPSSNFLHYHFAK